MEMLNWFMHLQEGVGQQLFSFTEKPASGQVDMELLLLLVIALYTEFSQW